MSRSTRLRSLSALVALGLGAGLATPAGALSQPTNGTESSLESALSTPREDSYYPSVGEPDIDTLHYDLDLTWAPSTKTFSGVATITFRAVADAADFQLDLGEALGVTSALLDGAPVPTQHTGKNLVVSAPLVAEAQHVLTVAYTGRPKPYPAPTTRSDFSTVGLTMGKQGRLWTMQEPYGAFTWYPVNDQPADKALYDFTIHTPTSMTGVANGRLIERQPGLTRFSTSEPMSSYLTTLAIAKYGRHTVKSKRGTTIVNWYFKGDRSIKKRMAYAGPAMTWLERRLGPYPFSSAGQVVTDSRSAMETQTMVTLGNDDYTLSKPVIVHELAHQWFGDQVSPTDWSDVWMNEGLAMYLQANWEAEHGDRSLKTIMQAYAYYDGQLRRQYGPPGAYKPANFGESNVYYCPALMWHQLRLKLGEKKFWAIMRQWPSTHNYGNATREDLLAFLNEQTGLDLASFYDTWLMSKKTPPHKL